MTKVKFYVDKDESILAVFPDEREYNGSMTCYARVGQHGTCSPRYINRLEWATPEQYAGLLEELKSVGYNDLKILQKRKRTPKIKLIVIVICLFLLSSCADVEPNAKDCMAGHVYGFWGGLWHGMITPFAWVGSLFSDDIAVWAVNNNGGWYTFGFVLGVGALSGSSTAAATSNRN